jgi:hypothetical protein
MEAAMKKSHFALPIIFAADGAGVSPASRHLRRVIPDLLFRTGTMNLTNNLFARRRVKIPGKKDYACAC